VKSLIIISALMVKMYAYFVLVATSSQVE